MFRLGRQREHHSDDTIENESTELSSSDSETDNTGATDTEPELSDDSMCELDGISSLFDGRSGCYSGEDDESDGDDDRESAKSESNSENDNAEFFLSDSERADDNTETTATEPELSDHSKCELDGVSSLFDKRSGSDLSTDDESDGDDDQESARSESDSEVSSIDSESTDNNTEATATELELSDDSLCELDGLSSLFDEHGESELGDDDECCYQHASDERKSVDNEDADAVITYHQQSCVDEDSPCLLDGVSTLFDERCAHQIVMRLHLKDYDRESESGDFPDAEERSVGMLVENKAENKQVPTVRSAADKGHWETAVKSLKIAAGVAGVGLAMYAAYKYFR